MDKGIVFCSVQYLKSDLKGKKKEFLKNMGFDTIVTDEAHQGSSTDKTRTDILDVETDRDRDVEDISKNIKTKIFASGTANKTIKYYNIPSSAVYEWEIEDEGYMKELLKPDLEETERHTIINYMTLRHGPVFLQCLQNNTLDHDYSKHPAQVLMKHSISQDLIDEITAYNSKHGTTFGYSYSALFALKQVVNAKGEACYAEEFDICKYGQDGIDILTELFELIISKNMMNRGTIMKHIEKTQTSYGSRQSTKDNPLLFIIYLPTHTGNNSIALLQPTLKAFLIKHHLWGEYNIEYANSTDNSGPKETFDVFIVSIMDRTKLSNKRGCILLLGDKGSVGITYNECDVTISLDDGHNLDNYQQRVSRSLTPSLPGAPLKTIGICVDLNIQRSYLYLNNILHKHRKNTKTTKTNAEILHYLLVHNIFLFDPQQINNGKLTTLEIMSYYQKEADNIMKNIDDTAILEQIVCEDVMSFVLTMDHRQTKNNTCAYANEDLEGLQQDCPKGTSDKVQIDAPTTASLGEAELVEPLTKEEVVVLEQLVNQTYEMCKTFLFPLLALMSRIYKITDFKEIFTHPRTKDLIISLLKDKKIELNKSNYSIIINIMNQIIDGNAEIVNNIREIYSAASSRKLRQLIEKHFVPTSDEKKMNAEVPTPATLVDNMLDVVPDEFWSEPRAVFEPCCGKGNFVLGIFDKFYKGLEELYPVNEDRCRVIMTECIYYADLTALNVFITTEIMKCHVQSYCGVEELDFEFNCYTGDTLLIDIATVFGLEKFDAVIGNPPYSTDPSKPDTKPLYDKFIEKYIDISKILLFVVPSRWFVGGKGLDKFRDFMMKRTDIALIQHEDDSKKWFGNGVNIEGGVNYFLKDAEHEGLCLFNGMEYALSKYDCIIKPRYHAIIDTVINMNSVTQNYCSSGYFKYRTNDSRLQNSGKIKCFVSLQKSKDRCKYLDTYEFNETNTFWKVITARANGKSPNFGAKFIGQPNEIYTDSYISFRVANEEEAKSLLSYLETKFANHMLSIRKISQDISENTCLWIPLVPLDRIWTDEAVCEHLDIEQSMYM